MFKNTMTTNKDVQLQNLSSGLISNLDDLIKQYRLLLEIVRKEKEVLIASDINQINDVNIQKENIILKVKALDSYRVACVDEISQALSLPVEGLRLLEIAQKVDGANGDRLRTQHATLELLTKRLSEINSSNAQVAEMALKNVNGALDSLKETIIGSKKTYQNKGKYQTPSEQANHLIRKEA